MPRFVALLCLVMAFLSGSLSVRSAEALVRLELVPLGGTSFVLQGSGLEGIAVLDCELTYDPSVMTAPSALRGSLIPSDAIFNFNPSVAGQIRLFIRMAARPLNGSGSIATLNFSSLGSAVGEIRTLTANLVSVKATPVAAVVQISRRQPAPEVSATPDPLPKTEPPPEVLNPGSLALIRPPAGVSPTSTPVAPASVSVAGTVAPSGDRGESPAERSEKRDADQQIEVAPETPPGQPQAALPSEVAHDAGKQAEALPALQVTEYQSVPERIRLHTGPRTPEALAELFRPQAGQKISQEPLVAVSDGESTLVLRIVLPSQQGDVPVFSLFHARMITMEQDNDGSWMLVVLPEKNSREARLTVSFYRGRLLYPLTIIPPTDRNGAGRPDHGDEYISAAHYLLKRQKVAPLATTL